MELSLGILLFCIFCPALNTLFSLPLTNRIGEKLRVYDVPNERKMHQFSTVRIGGLSIYFGYIVTILSLKLFSIFSLNNHLSFLNNNPSLYNLSLIGSSLFFFLGFADDIFNLSAFKRLLIQFIFCGFIWSQGLAIKVIDLGIFSFFEKQIILGDFSSYLLTSIFIVGIINATNWIDGLDGQATILTIISLTGFFIINLINQNILLCLFILAFICACLSFLRENLIPARIFMGDGGSYLLGFNSSFFAIKSFYAPFNLNHGQELTNSVNFFVLFCLLFVPISDMLFVILNRIRKGKSPFKADCEHIHHRLLRKGYSEKQTRLIICFVGLIALTLGLLIYFI